MLRATGNSSSTLRWIASGKTSRVRASPSPGSLARCASSSPGGIAFSRLDVLPEGQRVERGPQRRLVGERHEELEDDWKLELVLDLVGRDEPILADVALELLPRHERAEPLGDQELVVADPYDERL